MLGVDRIEKLAGFAVGDRLERGLHRDLILTADG